MNILIRFIFIFIQFIITGVCTAVTVVLIILEVCSYLMQPVWVTDVKSGCCAVLWMLLCCWMDTQW